MSGSGRQATLHADALRATRWVVENVDESTSLGRRIVERALTLVENIASALSGFDVEERARDADEDLVRLRVLLRIALDTGAISDGGFVHLSKELDGIGRQLGGWLRWLAGRHSAR